MSDNWKSKVFTASNIISAIALIASIFSFVMSYQPESGVEWFLVSRA
jgi:hypothetical protein